MSHLEAKSAKDLVAPANAVGPFVVRYGSPIWNGFDARVGTSYSAPEGGQHFETIEGATWKYLRLVAEEISEYHDEHLDGGFEIFDARGRSVCMKLSPEAQERVWAEDQARRDEIASRQYDVDDICF